MHCKVTPINEIDKKLSLLDHKISSLKSQIKKRKKNLCNHLETRLNLRYQSKRINTFRDSLLSKLNSHELLALSYNLTEIELEYLKAKWNTDLIPILVKTSIGKLTCKNDFTIYNKFKYLHLCNNRIEHVTYESNFNQSKSLVLRILVPNHSFLIYSRQFICLTNAQLKILKVLNVRENYMFKLELFDTKLFCAMSNQQRKKSFLYVLNREDLSLCAWKEFDSYEPCLLTSFLLNQSMILFYSPNLCSFSCYDHDLQLFSNQKKLKKFLNNAYSKHGLIIGVTDTNLCIKYNIASSTIELFSLKCGNLVKQIRLERKCFPKSIQIDHQNLKLYILNNISNGQEISCYDLSTQNLIFKHSLENAFVVHNNNNNNFMREIYFDFLYNENLVCFYNNKMNLNALL
jgi:hypothetical protein